MVPLLTSSCATRSNSVVTLKAFDWPGVGALKPVLTVPRTPKLSVKCQFGRELAVGGRAEVVEVFVSARRRRATTVTSVAHRRRRRRRSCARSNLPPARLLKPGKPFDAALKPWSASGPTCEGLVLADGDLELLDPVLDADGEVRLSVNGHNRSRRSASVELRVGTRVEVDRACRAERGIHGVVDEEVDVVAAGPALTSQVKPSSVSPRTPARSEPVADVTAEVRGEATREHLLEAEAVVGRRTPARARPGPARCW